MGQTSACRGQGVQSGHLTRRVSLFPDSAVDALQPVSRIKSGSQIMAGSEQDAQRLIISFASYSIFREMINKLERGVPGIAFKHHIICHSSILPRSPDLCRAFWF
nr:MAG TPA_asm: hypothetical protein [Caudoviricetes sp.]